MAWPSGSSTPLSWARLIAPSRSTRPGVVVASTMVEAAPPGDVPPSTTTSTSSPSISSAPVGLGRGRAAGQVGRADRERAGALEDLERDRVVGHPDRDRAARVAEVPLQRGVGVADQGQRARPELLDQRPGPRRDPDRQRVEGRGGGDQDRRGHVAAAALGVEELLDRVLVEGVGGQAVDGVRRQHDEVTALDGQAGGLDRGLALLVGRRRVAHRPIVPAGRW